MVVDSDDGVLYQWAQKDTTIEKIWVTKPTYSQKSLIAGGVTELSGTVGKESGRTIQHQIHKRADGSYEIINTRAAKVDYFSGGGIAATCKLIHDEVLDLLYGENWFVFDNRGNALAFTGYGDDEKEHKEYLWLQRAMPDIFQEGDYPIDEQKLSTELDRLFDKGSFLSKFFYGTSMTRFFHIIGKENAARIKKVKIQGLLKTILGSGDLRPLGFCRLVPLQAKILGSICGNFRELILDLSYSDRVLLMGDLDVPRWQEFHWDDDAKSTTGMSDEEKIDVAVRKIVACIPTLRRLQLGEYSAPTNDENPDVWGKSLRWSKFIEDRDSVLQKARWSNVAVSTIDTPEGQELRRFANLPARSNRGNHGTRGRGSGGRNGRQGSSRKPRASGNGNDQASLAQGQSSISNNIRGG
ncbi:hypothetical protein B0J14DRAFT_121518 [Halenospora varia]|nr:hypothetical protein B0J14DRAFT_121518 [Halenospora varia]